MLYERSNVAVHPRGLTYLDLGRRGAVGGGNLSGEITGRLALTRANGSLHLSWSPTSPSPAALPPAPQTPGGAEDGPAESVRPGTPSGSAEAYAVADIPVADICALKRHTPTIGFHFVIVVLHSGAGSGSIHSQLFLRFPSRRRGG